MASDDSPNAEENQDAAAFKDYQARLEKAGESVRSVAKWVVGGVAATAAGVIAGASLTSLGSLDWGGRLALAAVAALAGIGLLGFLLSFALDVITPRSYSMEEIANGKDITPQRLAHLNHRLARSLPQHIQSIEEFVRRRMDLYEKQRKGMATQEDLTDLAELERSMPFIRASIIYEHLLLLFRELRRRLVWTTPFVILAFGIYAWAANPAKSAVTSPAGSVVCCAAPKDPASTTAVGLPAKGIDLTPLLEMAIREVLATGQNLFTPEQLAEKIVSKFTEAASAELGKDLVAALFKTEKKGTEGGPAKVSDVVGPLPQLTAIVQPVDIFPFKTNRYDLPAAIDADPALKSRLALLVQQMQSRRCKLRVEGYADRRGHPKDNLFLALQRANAVARHLSTNFLAPWDALEIAGHDGRHLDSTGLDENRRVTVSLACRGQ